MQAASPPSPQQPRPSETCVHTHPGAARPPCSVLMLTDKRLIRLIMFNEGGPGARGPLPCLTPWHLWSDRVLTRWHLAQDPSAAQRLCTPPDPPAPPSVCVWGGCL